MRAPLSRCPASRDGNISGASVRRESVCKNHDAYDAIRSVRISRLAAGVQCVLRENGGTWGRRNTVTVWPRSQGAVAHPNVRSLTWQLEHEDNERTLHPGIHQEVV